MKIEFDHVHLNSADVNAAVDFYVEKFGGKKTGEVEVAGTNMVLRHPVSYQRQGAVRPARGVFGRPYRLQGRRPGRVRRRTQGKGRGVSDGADGAGRRGEDCFRQRARRRDDRALAGRRTSIAIFHPGGPVSASGCIRQEMEEAGVFVSMPASFFW